MKVALREQLRNEMNKHHVSKYAQVCVLGVLDSFLEPSPQTQEMQKLEKIQVHQYLTEIKEIKHILKELERTAETNGCYCPYNKVYPCQARVVHQIREILREKIENE